MDNRARAFRATAIKLGAFAVSMLLVFVGLVVVFSNYRSGSSVEYSALFSSASQIKAGSKVRIAGVEVGSVKSVSLNQEHEADITFTVDQKYKLPTSVQASVRYENLTGDRYLELRRGTGDPDRFLSDGAQIPLANTRPALDLDKLLGGFKPLFRTLNPEEVNEMSASLIAIFQGESQAVAMRRLLDSTAEFTSSLADRDELIGEVVDNLNETLGTIDADKQGFDTSVDLLGQLVAGLSEQRQTIGNSLTQTAELTNSLADLLITTRPDMKETVANLGRTSDEILKAEPYVRSVLQRLPEDYKILSNVGSYGAWLQLWLCRIRIMFDGPNGNTIWFTAVDVTKQTTNPGGRCYPR